MIKDADYINFLYGVGTLFSSVPFASSIGRRLEYEDSIFDIIPPFGEISIICDTGEEVYSVDSGLNPPSNDNLVGCYNKWYELFMSLRAEYQCHDGVHLGVLNYVRDDWCTHLNKEYGNLQWHAYYDPPKELWQVERVKCWRVHNCNLMLVQFCQNDKVYNYFSIGGAHEEWYLLSEDVPLIPDEAQVLLDYIELSHAGAECPECLRQLIVKDHDIFYCTESDAPNKVDNKYLVNHNIFPSKLIGSEHGWYELENQELLDYIQCKLDGRTVAKEILQEHDEYHGTIKETGSSYLVVRVGNTSCIFYQPMGYKCVYMNTTYNDFVTWAFSDKAFLVLTIRRIRTLSDSGFDRFMNVLRDCGLPAPSIPITYRKALTLEAHSLREMGDVGDADGE